MGRRRASSVGRSAAITIIGLGLSAVLAGHASRRTGGLLILAGLGWLGLIDLIGANAGSALQYYAYLAGRSSLPAGSGLLLVAAGIVTHPQRVFTQLHLRMHYIWTLIRPVGIVGLASAWGFGAPVRRAPGRCVELPVRVYLPGVPEFRRLPIRTGGYRHGARIHGQVAQLDLGACRRARTGTPRINRRLWRNDITGRCSVGQTRRLDRLRRSRLPVAPWP